MSPSEIKPTEDPGRRASILLEALPYIRRFHQRTIVIKFGGAAMKEEALRRDFATDLVLMQYIGLRPVVVHGGGPQINQLLKDLGIQSEFIDGHRVTDANAMDVVEMVLAGKVNKEIVALVNQAGGRAVGLTGKDGGLAQAKQHYLQRKNDTGGVDEVPLGQVGTLTADDIRPAVITTLEKDGYIPIIAPVAVDEAGRTMNINADTMAGAVAGALKAEKLMLLTDTPGVLHEGKTVTGLKSKDVRELIETGVISGGMIPKVECCLRAIDRGVRRTHIIDGRVAHALLLEIFTDTGVGTLIASDDDEPIAPQAR